MWDCWKNRTLTADILRANKGANKEKAKEFINSLTADQLALLQYDWSFWARDEQLPPKEWINGSKYIWIIRAGRGWGKTRTASQAFIEVVKSGQYKHLTIAGATAEEVRGSMIEGESGIKACCPPELGLEYIPSKKMMTFKNGVKVRFSYGTEPEQPRSMQQDFLWCDEIHKWRYPKQTFDNLQLGLRLGTHPLCLITSTPKPTTFVKYLENLKNSKGESAVVLTRGSTYDNKANLAKTFYDSVVSQYEGTRLALQELHGEILDDNPNALFKKDWIDNNRVNELPLVADRYRIVTSIDPAVSHNKKTSNHTGIITIIEGKAPNCLMLGGEVQRQNETHYYVIRDNSIIGTPSEWGSRAVTTSEVYNADTIAIEDNQGGDMVESTLINAGCKIPIQRIHSVKSKQARATLASLLFEQGRIHFYRNEKDYKKNNNIDNLDVLEDELCNWIPGQDSPDRLDAFVHGVNILEPTPDNKEAEENARYALIGALGL
ncbi:MAG: hypothetical protein CR988_07795 [Treponema sp.]|nr:MAG: hypothetical protein CR988_07795 [Treponema sp.]